MDRRWCLAAWALAIGDRPAARGVLQPGTRAGASTELPWWFLVTTTVVASDATLVIVRIDHIRYRGSGLIVYASPNWVPLVLTCGLVGISALIFGNPMTLAAWLMATATVEMACREPRRVAGT